MGFGISSIENGKIERVCDETGFASYEPLLAGSNGDPMGPLHITPSLRGLLPPPKHGQALANAIGRKVVYWGRQSPHDDLTFDPQCFPRPDQATSYATTEALMKLYGAIGQLLTGVRS